MACLGLGSLFFNTIRNKVDTQYDNSLILELDTAYILGGGILANLWLLLSLAGWFSSQLVATIVLSLAVIGGFLNFQYSQNIIKQIRGILSEIVNESWDWKILIGLIITICLAWVTSIGGLLSNDGMGFYMAIAKVVAYSHQLILLPGFEEFTSIGLHGEMHYAALISLGSPDAAQLYSWPIMLAGLIMLLGVGKLTGLGRRGQWLMIAMVLSSTAVVNLSGSGKVDLFAFTLGTAAYYWIIKCTRNQSHFGFLLTGLLCGFATVAKLSYFPILLVGIPLLYFGELFIESNNQPLKRFKLGQIAGNMIFIIAGFLIAITPHLIKNYLFYNNPFSPFEIRTMGWTDQVWHTEQITRRIILTYPLQLFYGTYWAQLGNLSPLILAFLPLVLFIKKQSTKEYKRLIMISATSIISIIFWIILKPSIFAPRHIMSSLLLLTIPAARGTEYIITHESNQRWLNIFIIGIICIALVSIMGALNNIIFFPSITIKYLSNKITECERYPIICEVMKEINRDANQGDRIFTITPLRYYLRPDLILCLPTTKEIRAYQSLDSAGDRWNFLVDHGFRYVLISVSDKDSIERLSMDNFSKSISLTKYVYERYILLRLDFTTPIQNNCREIKPLI